MKAADDREAGWREHEEARVRAWLTTTPLERLRWLDGAKRFAAKAMQAASDRSSARSPGSCTDEEKGKD